MISVSNLAKSFGPQTLFENVAFQLNRGNSYGLVGANGSGKSTLLKVLCGADLPTDGTVSIPKKITLGVLGQDHFQFEETPILNVVLMGNSELWEAMSAKEEILANAEESFDAELYSTLEDVIVKHDGYSVEARAAEILDGLGIPTKAYHEPLSTLSGGFKLRVLLAQTLASQPDALMLDEPTNHLDILSIRWLEKFLQLFKGVSVVISHDHRFLDNVCTHILDVDYATVSLYAGNYSAFAQAKQAESVRKEKDISKRIKDIEHHQAFVERFRAKASKARQAQSKMRLIEKKQAGLAPLPQSSRRYPNFRFEQRRPSGRRILEIENLGKSYGDNRVLHEVTMTIQRGERVAIIGPNGIGKSTLLKIVVGELKADEGKLEWGHETHIGYFAQDHRQLLNDARKTVEGWLWEHCPAEQIGFVRSHLARVLFTKDEVEKRLQSLSGGEAARLIFAKLAVQRPNVLVLDEPTNHLDLESIEALIAGLQSYEGSLILVSHDRWFVSKLATRIVEISPDGLQDFAGSYADYVEQCGDDHLDSDSVRLKVRREKRRDKKERRGSNDHPQREKQARELQRQQATVAGQIESKESRIAEINELFCDPSFFKRESPKKVRTLEQEQKQLTTEVEDLTKEWETLEESLSLHSS